MLDLKDVSFRYGAKSPPIGFRELRVARGERVFLYGPSGSGKTTLLGLLAGVLRPERGAIRLLGKDLAGMSDAQRDAFRGNHIGYVFQQFNLLPYLTVLENILVSCELNPDRGVRIPHTELSARAKELAEGLGISAFLDRPVTELSVGQQQRVAAARALLGSPELLIADEPTSALDFDHRESFLKLLFAECETRGSTLLFVSHDRPLEKLFHRSVSLLEIRS